MCEKSPARKPILWSVCGLSIALWVAFAIAKPSSLEPVLAGERPAGGAVARGDAWAAPPRLSETGLYGSDGNVDPRNLSFVPQYPLWSDGAEKQRWIQLPEGSKIDVSDVDAWRFPAGTKLWKQFSWSGRKIETRMLWKVAGDEWIFATYLWNEDQKDAVLAPETGVPNVFEIARGKSHSIPGIEDCHACHQASPSTVLGFSALQ